MRRPGKPQPDLVFADLPGYGFARVPKEVTEQWSKFINPYLEKRESLAACIVLVDVTIPPQDLDLQLIKWLRHVDRKFLLVATKSDRISGNQLRTSLKKLGEELGVPLDQIIPYSAKARVGYDELWKAMKAAARVEERERRTLRRRGKTALGNCI